MNDQHHHNWQPADNGYTCTECAELTTGCNTCNRPLETALLTCDRCINRARDLIRSIETDLNTVPFHHAEIMGLRAARYDRVLVTTSDDAARLPFGLDAIVEDWEDTRIEAAKSPTTATDTLYEWACAWADKRDAPHPWDWATYLKDHTLWAAQNPDLSGWHEYLVEARRVRATIRQLLGIEGEKEAAPCVHCGGAITREWTDHGLEDTRRCQQCGITWPDEHRLNYANRHTVIGLRLTNPDMLVTIEEAKAILPEARRGTLDTWARRGIENPDNAKFPIRGRNVRGTPTYRLGDIADAWYNREQRTA